MRKYGEGDFLQLFVRINIEPEFEKSLYEEAPANIHDSNDDYPPSKQRKCGGGDSRPLGQIA